MLSVDQSFVIRLKFETLVNDRKFLTFHKKNTQDLVINFTVCSKT